MNEESNKEKEQKREDVAPGADLEPLAIADENDGLDAEERARREAEAEERARREAEATAEVSEPEVATPARKLDAGVRVQGTGKRKNSVARVMITPGEGVFTINGRSIEDYFPRASHQALAKQALVATGYESAVAVQVRVHGGGISGQAGAIRHGIARALCDVDGELRGDLKKRGMLTRDARVKERRKAGFKKARKRPQFSKR